MNVKIEVDRVPQYIKITEITIRQVKVEEIDGEFGEIAFEEEIKIKESFEYRVQGHVDNISKHHLGDVQYDVSYYDKDNVFLGLDKSEFLDEDEIEPQGSMIIDMELQMPYDTYSCKFNIRAKKIGFLGKLF